MATYKFSGVVTCRAEWLVDADSAEAAAELWREALNDNCFFCDRLTDMRDDSEFEFSFDFTPKEFAHKAADTITEEAEMARDATDGFRAAHGGKSEVELNGWHF